MMNQQKKVRKLLKRVEILDRSFDTDDNDTPKQRINNKMKYRKLIKIILCSKIPIRRSLKLIIKSYNKF